MKNRNFVPVDYGADPWSILREWGDTLSMNLQSILIKVVTELPWYKNILCSISGGWDSDILIDMMERFGGHGKTTYIFLNTGLEYEATKRHIEELKKRYGVEIQEVKPKKAIPLCVHSYGLPFWSKYVSQMLQRLQKHHFQWEDEPFEELYARYPRCKSALRFWCNDFKTENGKESKFNIAYVPWLKEFIMSSPPEFLISPKCCDYAKKDPAHDFLSTGKFDMNVVGVRKAEKGARSTAYTSCFDGGPGGANFRPLFWMTDAEKVAYCEHFAIIRSDCYEVWGMKRTGCAGCPFGKEFAEEVILAETFEPKMAVAMNRLFGPSYEYTQRFMEFRKTKGAKKDEHNQTG